MDDEDDKRGPCARPCAMASLTTRAAAVRTSARSGLSRLAPPTIAASVRMAHLRRALAPSGVSAHAFGNLADVPSVDLRSLATAATMDPAPPLIAGPCPPRASRATHSNAPILAAPWRVSPHPTLGLDADPRSGSAVTCVMISLTHEYSATALPGNG